MVINMKIEKYHGCGNDFIIINQKIDNIALLSKKLCSRHLGVGADGLIIIDEDNLFVRFFNADGGEANVCGNGLRCLGLYLYKHNTFSKEIFVNTKTEQYKLMMIESNIVKVIFPLKNVSVNSMIISIDEKDYNVMLIDVGNKHCIILNQTPDEIIVQKIAEQFENTNISFVTIENRFKIRVNTYENGVGFTLSCGSASLSSAICLYTLGLIDDKVNIDVDYGKLQVNVQEYSLTGSANYVFQGEIDEEF